MEQVNQIKATNGQVHFFTVSIYLDEPNANTIYNGAPSSATLASFIPTRLEYL